MEKRTTLQKKTIYMQIHKMHDHPTADEVYSKVRKELPKISRATVYRNLNELADQKKILRVKVPSNADRYDYMVSDHSHILCASCQKLFDINAPSVATTTGIYDGFRIDDCHITYVGLCPTCLGQLGLNKLKGENKNGI